MIENDWWSSFGHADSNDIHKFYASLRIVVVPPVRPLTPVRSAAENLLRSREEVLDRWKEHFSRLLNENTQYDASTIEDLPSLPVEEKL